MFMVAHASNNLRTNDVSTSFPLFLQNLPSQLSIYSGFSEDDGKQRLFWIFFHLLCIYVSNNFQAFFDVDVDVDGHQQSLFLLYACWRLHGGID